MAMPRRVLAFIFAVLLGASSVAAEYTDFFWPNATKQSCPNMKYACNPPAICARSEPQKIWYCCVPGNKDEVCHTSAPGCDGGNGKPSGAQQPCSSGANAFCCLDQSQRCTQSFGQVDVCWATEPNPVALLDDARMNATYKSLRAARPSAASYSINLAALQSLTSTSPSSSGSSTGTPSPSTSPPPGGDSNSGLSGGAIGGIVGGVVGGLALIGAIVFLLWRRRKQSTVAQADPSSLPYNHQPDTGYQQDIAEMHNTSVGPAEKYARNGGYVSELPTHEAPIEMCPETPRQHH